MSRLSEKQLLILTIGITVLLSGGLGFLIWSDLQTIEKEEEKIAGLKDQIRVAKREIDLIPSREFRVIGNREIADREVAFLPEEEEIENFWEVLERFAVESGVRISEIAPSTTRQRGRRGKSSGPIASVPQILSLRATTDEFLRFINLIENYERIINVVEYSLSAGDTQGEDGKIRHSIRLALTTFTYSKKIANTIISIPKYDEKKNHAEVKKWLSRIKIQEKETYTLTAPVGRRDPFVSIRRKPTGPQAGVAEADRGRQEAILQNLVELVRALEEGLNYEDELQRRGDLWRLQAQRKENLDTFKQLGEAIGQAETVVSIRELQEQFVKDVKEPYERIKERMEKQGESDPPLALAHVQERLDRVQQRFDERDWIEVQNEVRDFLDASRKGEHVVEEARPLVAQIVELGRAAKVIENFEKRKVFITTIVFSPNGRSVAIINNKQMQEGDALDAEGTVLIVEIGENYVIFETEGVEIKKTQKGK